MPAEPAPAVDEAIRSRARPWSLDIDDLVVAAAPGPRAATLVRRGQGRPRAVLAPPGPTPSARSIDNGLRRVRRPQAARHPDHRRAGRPACSARSAPATSRCTPAATPTCCGPASRASARAPPRPGCPTRTRWPSPCSPATAAPRRTSCPNRVALAAETGCGGIVCAAADLVEARQIAPRLLPGRARHPPRRRPTPRPGPRGHAAGGARRGRRPAGHRPCRDRGPGPRRRGAGHRRRALCSLIGDRHAERGPPRSAAAAADWATADIQQLLRSGSAPLQRLRPTNGLDHRSRPRARRGPGWILLEDLMRSPACPPTHARSRG